MGRCLTYAVSGAMAAMTAALLLLAVNIVLWQMPGPVVSHTADAISRVAGAPYLLYYNLLQPEPSEGTLLAMAVNLLLWGVVGALLGLGVVLCTSVLDCRRRKKGPK